MATDERRHVITEKVDDETGPLKLQKIPRLPLFVGYFALCLCPLEIAGLLWRGELEFILFGRPRHIPGKIQCCETLRNRKDRDRSSTVNALCRSHFSSSGSSSTSSPTTALKKEACICIARNSS